MPHDFDALAPRAADAETVLTMTSDWLDTIRDAYTAEGATLTPDDLPGAVADAFRLAAVRRGLIGADLSAAVRALRAAGRWPRAVAGWLVSEGAVRREHAGAGVWRYVVAPPEPWLLALAAAGN